MKDFITKIGRFCENHVEKIVLVLVGAVCVWLFFTRIIFSPNMVAIDGKNLSPGQIDRYVYEQKASELNEQLHGKKTGKGKTHTPKLTSPIPANDPVVADLLKRPLPKGFAGLFESPLDFIGTTQVAKAATASSPRNAGASRKYRLPLIPDVTNVAANHIRAAAYVPLGEVTAQKAYDAGTTEPNDIDLVTVEAKFDVAEVFRRYQASFNGVDVQREEWRDPCLAVPVFAAVQLERQELTPEGSWSDWQPLPRSRVESNRELFEVVEKVGDLPVGGMAVRMMQFNRKDLTMGLLQPEGYQFASAEEDWFPPSLYGKFKDIQKRVDAEERKEQREQDRGQDERGADGGRRGDSLRGGAAAGGMQAGGTRGGRGRPQMGLGGDTNTRGGRGGRGGQQMPGDPMAGGMRGRGGRRGGGPGDEMYGDPYGGMQGMGADGRRKASTNEVYFDLREELLTFRDELSKRTKPLLIWVFDDTGEPGKTYQYRMRVGVFNPVAGTGQLIERDVSKNDQVILWSPYSEVTKPISIPKRIYLFAKGIQDKTKAATVEVVRYTLGYWRSEDFQVKPGEAIGKPLEPAEPERDNRRNRDRRFAAGQMDGRITDDPMAMMDPMYATMPSPDEANKPKIVDYDTGKVLVDLVEVSDWSEAPNLKPRMYHDMLYTSDGISIEHMPVSMTNWPRDLAETYQFIQREKSKEPKPFRAFNKGSMRGGRGGMMDPYGGAGGYEGMYDMGPGAYR